MNKQYVTTIYVWLEYRKGIDVTIARHGKYGYSEHAYSNVSIASMNRILAATPPRPSYIEGNFWKYDNLTTMGYMKVKRG